MTVDYKNKHYHQWFLERAFPCAVTYTQFLNWLQFEFYFLQQDHGACVTLYFPNGQVKVKKIAENDSTLVSKIAIESQCRTMGLKIKKRFSDFLDRVDRYHSLS